MCSVSTVEGKLPPGFRFHPKDEELIYDYLMKWILGSPLQFPLLIVVDLNKCEPWDIPITACVGGKEWYFYSKRDRKYATGLRTNRATVSGYWKATGKDRPIVRMGALIGMRKTLVFYQGRAPKGSKTDWIMHEFRLEAGPGPDLVQDQDWVLCRVFCKNLRSSSPSSDQQTSPTTAKHENPNLDFISTPSSSSLPSLTEFPYNNIGIFEFEHDNNCSNYDCHLGQVPCFSNILHNNTISPNVNPSQEMLWDNNITKKELMNNYQYCNNSVIKSSSSSCSPSFVDNGVGCSSFWD